MAAPKSGQVQGGNAQEGRRQPNAAPQQYAPLRRCPQGESVANLSQNAAEILDFVTCLPAYSAA
jgi:hypothetical protein